MTTGRKKSTVTAMVRDCNGAAMVRDCNGAAVVRDDVCGRGCARASHITNLEGAAEAELHASTGTISCGSDTFHHASLSEVTGYDTVEDSQIIQDIANTNTIINSSNNNDKTKVAAKHHHQRKNDAENATQHSFLPDVLVQRCEPERSIRLEHH
jgi:hypothetical protein